MAVRTDDAVSGESSSDGARVHSDPNRSRDENPQIDPRIAAAVAGDRQAAHQLLAEFLPRVRNLVRYLSRGDSEVDDIAQQALVELLRSLGNYRGEGSLRAWADRITARVCLAHLKRNREDRTRRIEHAPDLWPVSTQDGGPDDYFDRREIARLLDRLPQEQREALVLHHVAGWSVPELAKMLGLRFETIRSRLRLGMQKLRQEYANKAES